MPRPPQNCTALLLRPPQPACAGYGPTSTAPATNSARTPTLKAQPCFQCGTPLGRRRRPAAPGCAALATAATLSATTRCTRLRRACDRRYVVRRDPPHTAAPRLRPPLSAVAS